MRRSPLRILTLLLLAIISTGNGPSPASAQSAPIVDVAPNDPAMRAAIAQARKTLPEFWDALARQAPGTQGFSLKVGLPAAGNETEHIWIDTVERIGDNRYSGRLGNDPRGIAGRKMGDLVEFDEAQISDWMFMRNGKMVGNETLRPLLGRMPKGQADKLRAMLEKP